MVFANASHSMLCRFPISDSGAIRMQEFLVDKSRRCLEDITKGEVVQVNRGRHRALKFTLTPAGASRENLPERRLLDQHPLRRRKLQGREHYRNN